MSVTETAKSASGRPAPAAAQELALRDYTPPGKKSFGSDPAWAALRATGTELWLDTGDLDAARTLWTDEFSNLTTNNTLVNKEVQKGLFDDLITEAGHVLRDADSTLSAAELVREVGFVVNCRTALRLVEAFNATVSVELHPGMADDPALSIEYGRRYYAVCPEKFIVKVPLTPGGFLAARQLAADGIPINYTLGFSARQNVLAAAFSRPAYVNVFMGRLNSFVADNKLGDGKNVGEKATLASQNALLEGRASRGWVSRQIGASLRSGDQIYALAGLDVFTMPPAAAAEYQKRYHAGEQDVKNQLANRLEVHSSEPKVLSALWDVDDAIYRAAEALEQAASGGAAPLSESQVADVVRVHVPDFFRNWTSDELKQIEADGKIPKWDRWKDELLGGRVALDDLLTVSALYSFVKDQTELDERIHRLLAAGGVLS